MTPAQKKTMIVTAGIVLAGIGASLEQSGAVPQSWAWVIPALTWIGGYLKGGALMQRPGDEKSVPDVGPLPGA